MVVPSPLVKRKLLTELDFVSVNVEKYTDLRLLTIVLACSFALFSALVAAVVVVKSVGISEYSAKEVADFPAAVYEGLAAVPLRVKLKLV